jgi:DNA replication protein DnaC
MKADPKSRQIFTKEALSKASNLNPPRCAVKMGQTPYNIVPEGAFAVAHPSEAYKNCAACFGLGMLDRDNQSVPCHQPPVSKVINNFNRAEIPAKYCDSTLEKFQNFSGNGERVVNQVRNWQKQFKPRGSKGLIVTGPVGVGKTYLLAALARNFVEQGLSVRFTDFFQLLAELRAGFSEGKADSTILAPLINVDVLLIDELGKGRNSDFELTTLDQLVSERYKRNLTIVASTNYKLTANAAAHAFNYDLDAAGSGGSDFSPDKFGSLEKRVGQRIFSRL